MSKITVSFDTPLGAMEIMRQAGNASLDELERVPATYLLNGQPISTQQYATFMHEWARREGFSGSALVPLELLPPLPP